MNLLCQLIAGAEFAAVRQEACRIEDKADMALNKAITLAADTAVMLKRASVVCGTVERIHETIQTIAERQKWLSQEQAKIADYLTELHGWLSENFRPGRNNGDYKLDSPIKRVAV